MANLFSVEGKVACVMGASSGLGQHAASVLAGAGAKVVVAARRRDKMERWRQDVGGENSAIVVCDLTRRDTYEATAEDLAQPFGFPDILVHAAGINLRQSWDDISADSWDDTLTVNLTAPFFFSQKLVAGMKERGWGRIVCFASLQTSRAFANSIPYGASKAGIGQLTRAMAEAWSRYGVNVNAIGPGFFKTELTEPVFADPERAARNAAQTCIGRNGEYADLDGPLLFLCSQASQFVTGQVLMVDGGFTAK